MIEDGTPPKVTVAMPVFNGGRFLRPAVLSIVNQTFTDWELLLIDDGSTDGSLETIQDLQDARIRVIKDGLNKGLAARLNEAIDLTRGPYLARMDQDDISYPERFAQQIALLEEDPRLDLVGTRSIAISQDDQIVGFFPYASDHQQMCAKPWRGFYLAHPTWMGKIEWFRRHRYATPGPYLSEDTELLLRSFSTSRFGIVPDILFAYRVRDKIAWRKMIKTRWTVFELQLRHFVGGKQFGFALLALLAFCARVGMDLFNFALQVVGAPIFLRFRGTVDAATKSKWQSVLMKTQSLS